MMGFALKKKNSGNRTIKKFSATFLPSHNKFNLDKQGIQGTVKEVKEKFINDVLPRTSTHRHTSIERPSKIYIHQLSTDAGCCLEDLPREITDRDR